MNINESQVKHWLDEVKDPEIPVISVIEMGIIRDINVANEQVQITLTPTFTGCPAIHVMQEDIIACLKTKGIPKVDVIVRYSPPWSSDLITPSGRDKLKSFGLAPPPVHQGNFQLLTLDIAQCPYCDSSNTSIKNIFGPTLCRAIFYCNACQQPFEQFKPL